jgi:integrase/recombinase XerD
MDFSKNVDLCAEITEINIVSYLSFLKEQHLQISTINRKLSALRQFFKFLCLEEYINSDPMKFIQQQRQRRALPKVLSEEVVQKLQHSTDLLEYSEKIRADLILYLLYGSGLRVSELISIKRNAIVNPKFIRIFGKGSRERIVPLSGKVMLLLEEWYTVCKDSIWVFPSTNPLKPITRQRVFQILKKIAAIAGIENISPHVLRHAFATHILDNGADLLSVKKMLGHQDIATTEIYTHVSRKKLRETVKKYHPLSS